MFNRGDVVIQRFPSVAGYYNVIVVKSDNGETVEGASIHVRGDGGVHNMILSTCAYSKDCELIINRSVASITGLEVSNG